MTPASGVRGPGTRRGAYDILTRLGSGGMGVVYRAREATLNRDVAITVLRPPYAALFPLVLARLVADDT